MHIRFICSEWVIILSFLFLTSQHSLCLRLNNRSLCLWSIFSSLRDKSNLLTSALCMWGCLCLFPSIWIFEPVSTNNGTHVLSLQTMPTTYMKFPMNSNTHMLNRQNATWNADFNAVYFVVLRECIAVNLKKKVCLRNNLSCKTQQGRVWNIPIDW